MYNNLNIKTNVKRGDILYIDFGIGLGCEQSGKRPVIVIQNDIGNKYSPALVVLPITSQVKRMLPTHVKIILAKESIVLTEQIRTVDRSRIDGDVIDRIDETTMEKVENAMLIELGVNNEAKVRERVRNVMAIKEVELLQNNEIIIEDRLRKIKEAETKEQQMIKQKMIQEKELTVRRYIKIKIKSIQAVDKAIFSLSIKDSNGLLATRKMMISELKKLCKNNLIEYNANIYNEGEIDYMITNRKNGVRINVVGGQLY